MMLGIFVKFSSHVIVLQLCKIMSFFFFGRCTLKSLGKKHLKPATTSKWFCKDRSVAS